MVPLIPGVPFPMFTVFVEVSGMLWVPGITSAPPIKSCSVYVPVLDAHIYCIMPGYILRCNFFSMLTGPAKVQKIMGADCSAFNVCSWWCDGIYEEWKPEILGCRRHISSRPVLCPHSIPSEACLCIINWFRYTIFFLVIWSFPLLGSFMNLDFSPDVFLILHSRHIGCATVSDGVSLQEVREDIPGRCRVTRVPSHGRRLLPWDLA